MSLELVEIQAKLARQSYNVLQESYWSNYGWAMKTLIALLLSSGFASACPFEVGAEVVAEDGRKGVVIDAFESAADAHLSATIRFEDGTTESFDSQPGVDFGDAELCKLRAE